MEITTPTGVSTALLHDAYLYSWFFEAETRRGTLVVRWPELNKHRGWPVEAELTVEFAQASLTIAAREEAGPRTWGEQEVAEFFARDGALGVLEAEVNGSTLKAFCEVIRRAAWECSFSYVDLSVSFGSAVVTTLDGVFSLEELESW